MELLKSKNYTPEQIENKFREVEVFIRGQLGGEPKVSLGKLDEKTLTALVRETMEQVFQIFTGFPSIEHLAKLMHDIKLEYFVSDTLPNEKDGARVEYNNESNANIFINKLAN